MAIELAKMLKWNIQESHHNGHRSPHKYLKWMGLVNIKQKAYSEILHYLHWFAEVLCCQGFALYGILEISIYIATILTCMCTWKAQITDVKLKPNESL